MNTNRNKGKCRGNKISGISDNEEPVHAVIRRDKQKKNKRHGEKGKEIIQRLNINTDSRDERDE